MQDRLPEGPMTPIFSRGRRFLPWNVTSVAP
jgi:hypothetical protein